MHLLRIVSRSNGWVAVIGTILCAVLSLGLILFFLLIWETDRIPAMIAGLLAAFFAGCFIHGLFGILAHHEYEFVMEEGGFRYGRVGRPGSQRKISRTEIKYLVYDDGPDPSLLLSTKGWWAPELVPGVINTKSKMNEVVDVAKSHWPEIVIYDRETFQRRSRSGKIAGK